MPFVQHGDRFCSWYTSDPADQIPVTPDWWGPPQESGWPHLGECRACHERGAVYEVPPLAVDVREQAAAFARWLREAISDRASRREDPAFVGHRADADVALMGWHGPTELIVMDGRGGAPERVLRCRECKSASYPCRTLRMVAAPYRFGSPGHREEWL
ncbi:hypothetical protein FHR32_002114 [Streptosporangium album]|uniref:Uncharacterized protein n=1 Tax=Streptosporangium album TaxID=47479 RepID=A0A7W7RTA7_9ACTN|nr:hypothetical protein [Streptosporangium album]MBB4937809.1 hypothetical protein [Streptosporangium album]